MKNPPLKRHKALQNLSREHHDSLVFVLRLQKGVANKSSIKEMEDYIQWYWEVHLKAHLEIEENHLFPMLSKNEISVEKVYQEHEQIKKIIRQQPKSKESITNLFQVLKAHIRFEERELFMLIQDKLSNQELAEFGLIHSRQIECGLWINRFWEQ